MQKFLNESALRKILLFLLSGIALFYLFEIWHIFRFMQLVIHAVIPIFIGIFISFLLEPLIVRLHRLGIKRKWACLLVYSSAVGLFLLTLIYLIPVMASQLQGFINYLPELTGYLTSFENSELSRTISSFHLEKQISGVLEECCHILFENLGHFLDSFVQFGIGAGAALYLSLDFKKVTAYYYDLAPKNYRKEYWIISKRIGHNAFMFLRSTLYDTFIFFALSALVLSICRFRYPLVFAAILAITNLIPYIGPYIGLIPLAISGFMISQSQGVLAILIAFGLQSIESSLICPLLLKNMIYLHPVVGIFSISFFGALFGVVGMIFSPLLMIIAKILYEEIILKQIWLEKKQEMVYNSDEIDEKDE